MLILDCRLKFAQERWRGSVDWRPGRGLLRVLSFARHALAVVYVDSLVVHLAVVQPIIVVITSAQRTELDRSTREAPHTTMSRAQNKKHFRATRAHNLLRAPEPPLPPVLC